MLPFTALMNANTVQMYVSVVCPNALACAAIVRTFAGLLLLTSVVARALSLRSFARVSKSAKHAPLNARSTKITPIVKNALKLVGVLLRNTARLLALQA